MRLPYAPSTPPRASSPGTAEIYARIAARRSPRPLIPLDLMLLHAPAVADGYNSFIGSLRSGTVLDPALFELAICRVAVLNQAVYEWNIHAPLALQANVKPEELQDAFSLPPFSDDSCEWKQTCLDVRQRVVLAYTDQMTRRIVVADELFVQMQALGLFEQEVVELTATIAGYNCVSRILVALDVGENNGRAMKSVEELVTR